MSLLRGSGARLLPPAVFLVLGLGPALVLLDAHTLKYFHTVLVLDGFIGTGGFDRFFTSMPGGFAYRPLFFSVFYGLHRLWGYRPWAFRLVFGGTAALTYGVLYETFLALGYRKRTSLLAVALTALTTPFLWQVWDFVDAEIMGVLGLYLAVRGYLGLGSSPSRRKAWAWGALHVAGAALALYGKETTQAVFVPILFLLVWFDRPTRWRGWILGIDGTLVLARGIAAALAHPMAIPKPPLTATWAVLVTSQVVHPFGFAAVALLVLGLLPRRALRWGAPLGLALLLLPPLPLYVFEEWVIFLSSRARPWVDLFALGLVAGVAGRLRSERWGDRFFAASILATLAAVVLATGLLPFTRFEASSRHFMSVLPMVALLIVERGERVLACARASPWTRRALGIPLALVVYHVGASAFDLAEQYRAHTASEWAGKQYLVDALPDGARLGWFENKTTYPDEYLLRLRGRSFQPWVLGAGQIFNPFWMEMDLERRDPSVPTYFYDARIVPTGAPARYPLLGDTDWLPESIRRYWGEDTLQGLVCQTAMFDSGPFPAEASLDRLGRRVFEAEIPFRQVPRFAETILRSLGAGMPVVRSSAFRVRVYRF